ncbi:MAG: hypothetical protein WC389_20120 [Lutibacter sp.]|jgi:hypothetical protein
MSIKDNTFAAACYNDNSIEELQDAISSGADAVDCKNWGIDATTWMEQMKLALQEKISNQFQN